MSSHRLRWRARALTADEELLWRSLMQLVIRIPRVTDGDFAHDSNLAISEYVVLMHLSEAPLHHRTHVRGR